KLQALFQEWGFRSLAAKLKSVVPAPPKSSLFAAFESTEVGDTEFEFGANARADDWHGDYKLIDTPEKFQPFLKELKRQRRFCFDLETTGLDPLNSELVGIA